MGMGFTHILEKEPNLIAMTGAAIVALATRGAASGKGLDMLLDEVKGMIDGDK